MAGLFGGPVVAITCRTPTMAWRLWLGGAGMGVGLLVVVICVSLGLLYRYARQRGKLDVGPRTCCFSDWWCMWRWWGRFSFCPPVVQRINEMVALPFIAIFTVATLLLGTLLKDWRSGWQPTGAELVLSPAARHHASHPLTCCWCWTVTGATRKCAPTTRPPWSPTPTTCWAST